MRLLTKITRNPVHFFKVVFRKLCIDPFQYSLDDDYKAEAYWKDRFLRYKNPYHGPGEEGATEIMIAKRYQRVTAVFKILCRAHIPNMENIRVLEIGTGTGLITEVLRELKVKQYAGVDITDAVFPHLIERFSGWQFEKLDITSTRIQSEYDLIVFIDVLEHIVSDDKFTFALKNLDSCLAINGIIIIAPLMERNYKAQFYERHWTITDLKKIMTHYEVLGTLAWENNFSTIVAMRKCR